MSFLYPEAFLLLLPMILFLLWRVSRRRVRFSRDAILAGAGILSLVAALSHPYTISDTLEEKAYGVDVVVAVDVSHSMSASDILPSRFDAAKRMVRDLVMKPGANRYAVMAFTSNALPLSPLTSDREILASLLDGIVMENILTKSTDIMAVLKKSAKILKSERKPVIVFSDGGDRRDFSEAIRFAKAEGIRVYFIPVASEAGTKLYDQYGEVLRDAKKHMVISAKNPYVRYLTDATGGIYMEDFDADTLLDAVNGYGEAVSAEAQKSMRQVPFFGPLLLAAFVCFLLTTVRVGRRSAAAVMLLVLLGQQAPLHAGALAFWHEYRAREAYAAGDFKSAAEHYEKLAEESEAYGVAFNLANSYYQLGRFDEAVILYEAIQTDDPAFKSAVYYNLANTYARKEEFEKADTFYLKSLILRYEADADRNRKIVARAKKGYNPDSLKKKGEGKKDKGTQPKGNKKPPEKKGQAQATDQAGKKVELSKEEQRKLAQAKKEKPLSYKQYQLINERSGSREENPW